MVRALIGGHAHRILTCMLPGSYNLKITPDPRGPGADAYAREGLLLGAVQPRVDPVYGGRRQGPDPTFVLPPLGRRRHSLAFSPHGGSRAAEACTVTSIWPALHHFFARFHHRRSRSAVARGLRHADRFLVLIGVLSALVVSESAGLPALLGDAARVREQPGRRGHACYPSRYGNFDIISPFLQARVRQRRCKDCN